MTWENKVFIKKVTIFLLKTFNNSSLSYFDSGGKEEELTQRNVRNAHAGQFNWPLIPSLSTIPYYYGTTHTCKYNLI